MYGQVTKTRNPESFIKFLESQNMDLNRYQYVDKDMESYIVKDIITGIKGSIRR